MTIPTSEDTVKVDVEVCDVVWVWASVESIVEGLDPCAHDDFD